MENSKIEWTDHSFNPWIGCQKVSPGCDNCYAERDMDHRFHLVQWGPHGERRRTKEANWKKPLRWAKAARESGTRPRVFCAPDADVFDNKADPQSRADLFDLIRKTPELDWLILTKRPQNIRKMLPSDWGDGYGNVWLGITGENQEEYDRRWPILARIPAVVRFVSCEPALGPLTPRPFHGIAPDWIICGGESGPAARMMDPNWARGLRDYCRMHGIKFFMKQMTGKKPIPHDLLVRQFPVVRRRYVESDLADTGYLPDMEGGLKAAIGAAGGLRPLARLLGIAHQSILQWEKVPAERVIEIEKVTGIARERLRPDLYRLLPRQK